MSVAVQPGMAFREKLHNNNPALDDSAVFMCLACLKWGLLVWQLIPQSMETWALDLTKQIQWKFLIDVADHEAADAIPTLDHHRGIEVKLTCWEPLVKTTLRLHSSKLTVQDLCALATIGFNIPEKEARACTKVQLVKALALKVADEDFAEIVCQSLSQWKKSEDDDTGVPEVESVMGLQTCFWRCWSLLISVNSWISERRSRKRSSHRIFVSGRDGSKKLKMNFD